MHWLVTVYCGAALVLASPAVQAKPPRKLAAVPEKGALVFFGDSITQRGDWPGGWVETLRNRTAVELGRPDIRIINAGQGGNTVQDLHRRFFWRSWRAADLVVVCVGINDARFAADQGFTPLDVEDYRAGLASLVKKIRNIGAGVLLCSPIIYGERLRGANPLDEVVDAYANAVREVAESESVPFLDLRSEFFERLREMNPQGASSGVLTSDALHLNDAGNDVMAEVVLEKMLTLPAREDAP